MKKLILAVAVLLTIYTPVASACSHYWKPKPQEVPVVIVDEPEQPEEPVVEEPVVEPEKEPQTEEVKAAATIAPKAPEPQVQAVVTDTSWGK